MRCVLRWMTAADERQQLAEVEGKIANREAGNCSPKKHVLEQRDQLRRTIWLRLGTEFVLLGALVAGTAAKLAGVFSSGSEPNAAGQVEAGQAGPLRNINFDAPGMMKTYVIVNLPEDPKAVDALHDKIGEALKLALQDPKMLEAYRTADISIIMTPDVRGTAQAAIERMQAGGGAGKGVDLRTWSGDAITLSTQERGKPITHLVMMDEKLMQDPLKFGVAMDHELGHVRKRNLEGGVRDIVQEEVDVFTDAIVRLRTLAHRLRVTNGPQDPMAQRLEQEIIPREEFLLRNWSNRRRR